jgi:hypothetical protein
VGVIVTATIVNVVMGGVVITMSSWSGRLRQAIAVNTKAPTVWLMAGAAVGLLATVLIPAPRPPEQPVIRAPADPETV